MKNSFYFAHDYSSREDNKIQKLIFKEKYEGYGLYWAIIEMLYLNEGYLDLECERIAFLLHSDCEKIKRIINDYDLFEFKNNLFFSHRILEQINLRKSKTDKAKKSAKIRWGKQNKPNANALQSECERTANAMLIKERKGKENKGNNIKENNTYIDNSTELQLSKLFLEQIKNNNPKFKEPNLQKWSDDFNKMIRIDKRTQEEIEALIYWCQQDNFWKSNILSAKTLREKFDRLWIKAKSDIEKKRNETFDL